MPERLCLTFFFASRNRLQNLCDRNRAPPHRREAALAPLHHRHFPRPRNRPRPTQTNHRGRLLLPPSIRHLHLLVCLDSAGLHRAHSDRGTRGGHAGQVFNHVCDSVCGGARNYPALLDLCKVCFEDQGFRSVDYWVGCFGCEFNFSGLSTNFAVCRADTRTSRGTKHNSPSLPSQCTKSTSVC